MGKPTFDDYLLEPSKQIASQSRQFKIDWGLAFRDGVITWSAIPGNNRESDPVTATGVVKCQSCMAPFVQSWPGDKRCRYCERRRHAAKHRESSDGIAAWPTKPPTSPNNDDCVLAWSSPAYEGER